MPRTARHQETRLNTARAGDQREMPQGQYKSQMYIPPHIVPKGFTYRWIRISVENEPDHNNWQNCVDNGWKPVPRDRHPKEFPSIPIPGMDDNRGNVIVRGGGLLLCERPTKDVVADQRAKRRENAETMQAVAQWTGEKAANQALPTFGQGQVGIERVTAMPGGSAEFKDGE